MKKSYLQVVLFALIVVFLTTSCNSTRVLASWSNPSPPDHAMNKVLVLGIMPRMDDRDNIEKSMVNELTNAGIQASTATSVFGPRGFVGMDEQQITEKLRSSDFTSVMIVSLVDREKEQRFVPGTRYVAPRVGFHRYYRRYFMMYDMWYSPGYFRTHVNYVLEADIFTIDDNDALIYSAQTQKWDPSNSRALGQSFARAIAADLRTNGLIK